MMNLVKKYILVYVVLLAGFGGAFGVDKYIIKNGSPIEISLDGFEAAVLNKATDSPYIFIGQLSGKCSRMPGFRNWSCENPNANAAGSQDIVLKTGISGVEISREQIYLLDKEISILVTSKLDSKVVGGGIEYDEKDFKGWLRKIITPNEKFIDLVRVSSGDEDFRSSMTYIPTTYDKASEYIKKDEDDNYPRVCQSGLTYINIVTSAIPDATSDVLDFTTSFGVSPTKEPIVGGFESMNSYDNRLFSGSAGDDLNKSILQSIGLPVVLSDYVNENFKKDLQNDLVRSNQILNYKKTTIFTLDTTDENKDTFEYRGISGHGGVVNSIIKSINKDADIRSINVCPGKSGNCDERLIIDGICQAILYNSRYLNSNMENYSRVIVNMSVSAGSASNELKELIGFARKNGIIFVVANGNMDACANYSAGTKCHQYPADWSKEYHGRSYAPMITVGAIDYLTSNRTAGFLLEFDRRATANSLRSADIYAPGEYYQLLPGFGKEQYIRRFGTSFSAPYVSGIISLWFDTLKGPKYLPCEMGIVLPSEGIISLRFPNGDLYDKDKGYQYGGPDYDYKCIND